MDPISAGIAGLGSLLSGVSGFVNATAQQKALDNAGRQALAEAGVEAQQRLQEGDAVAASAAVQAAANGGGFVGSTLGVLQGLSQKAMFNARAAAYAGITRNQDLRYEGELARAQGSQGLLKGVVGAGAAAFGGFAGAAARTRAASMFAPNPTGGGLDELAGLF